MFDVQRAISLDAARPSCLVFGSLVGCNRGEARYAGGSESVRDLSRRSSIVTMCCACQDTLDMSCTNDPGCRGIRRTTISQVDESHAPAYSKFCESQAMCTTTVYNDGTRVLVNKHKNVKVDPCLPKELCINQFVDTTSTTPGCRNQNYTQIPVGRYCTYCCENEHPENIDYCFNVFLSFQGQQNYSFPPVTASTPPTTTTSPPVTSTTSVHTKTSHPTRHQSTTGSSLTTQCELCDGASCSQTHSPVVTCSVYESYCLNVLHVDEHGNFSVIKKGCSSRYECLYDHSSLRADPCNFHGTFGTPSFAPGTERLCQFCCDGSSASGPCNTQSVPQNTVDFDPTSSTPASATTLHTPPSTQTTTMVTPLSTETTTMVTPPSTQTPTLVTSPNTQTTTMVTPPTHHIVIPTHTNTHPASTEGTSALTHSTQLSSATTEIPSSASSTRKTTTTPAPGHYTLPAVTTQCAVCLGPPEICEQLKRIVPCDPPNNYCINLIHNRVDGSRTVNRTCGNIDTCYRDWYVGTSDSDKCQEFSEQRPYFVEFDCTFCCVKNGCNYPLKPPDDTLYQDKRN